MSDRDIKVDKSLSRGNNLDITDIKVRINDEEDKYVKETEQPFDIDITAKDLKW